MVIMNKYITENFNPSRYAFSLIDFPSIILDMSIEIMGIIIFIIVKFLANIEFIIEIMIVKIIINPSR